MSISIQKYIFGQSSMTIKIRISNAIQTTVFASS